MRILIVEDELRLASIIKKGLTEDGFEVDVADNGEEGLRKGRSSKYNLCILDITLPRLDGLTVCKKLRNEGIRTPIFILSVKDKDSDKTAAFNYGADDYMTKPFSFLELKYRIHTRFQNNKKKLSKLLRISDLVLDTRKHEAMRGGKLIHLTPKEFSILELLMRHKDTVVTRDMILENVWNYNFNGISNVVDVFIAALRNKIDKNSKVKILHTINQLGYKISEDLV